MMIQSDSTWVPRVTELRSPPASRMTGALPPVIAVSFTDATPTTRPRYLLTEPGVGHRLAAE